LRPPAALAFFAVVIGFLVLLGVPAYSRPVKISVEDVHYVCAIQNIRQWYTTELPPDQTSSLDSRSPAVSPRSLAPTRHKRHRDTVPVAPGPLALGKRPRMGPAGQSPQLGDFEAQRLAARDVPVRRGAVGHPIHQQCLGARVRGLEPVPRTHQRGREPARDPQGVVSVHVGFPFTGIASALVVGTSA
jgi:hypothetical protein